MNNKLNRICWKPLKKAVSELLYIQKIDFSVYKKSWTSQNSGSVIFTFGIEIYNIFKFPSYKTVSSFFFAVESNLPIYYLSTSNRYDSTGSHVSVSRMVTQ